MIASTQIMLRIMRFPRDIREEGTLYVVDEVQEVGGGGSYMAMGMIKKFVQ